jgi:flavodoxin/ferredoxin
MTKSNLSRRKFVLASSAAVGAPLVMKMSGAVPNVAAAAKEPDPKYKGMKSLVIFYSQTGNTKAIAQALQKGIIQQTGQCDIARVKEIKQEELAKYDLIGIGSPTWSSCPSPIVLLYIKSLPATLKSKHFFWYSTHGIYPGRCVMRGVQTLLDQGLTVLGWKDWYGQASLAGHGKPWYTDGHPDEIDLAEAEAFGAAMVVHSRKVSGGQTDIIPALHSKEASDQFYGIGHPFLNMGGGGARRGAGGDSRGGAGASAPAAQTSSNVNTEAKAYSYPSAIPKSMDYVCQMEGVQNREGSRSEPGNELKINGDKCVKCKRCVKGCPCNNIDDSVFPYAFKTQNCEYCMFCEGICPTGAVEFKFRAPNANAGNAERPMNGPLALAEARGRFRRLLKEEDVGFNTPWETVTGHPRLKELP